MSGPTSLDHLLCFMPASCHTTDPGEPTSLRQRIPSIHVFGDVIHQRKDLAGDVFPDTVHQEQEQAAKPAKPFGTTRGAEVTKSEKGSRNVTKSEHTGSPIELRFLSFGFTGSDHVQQVATDDHRNRK